MDHGVVFSAAVTIGGVSSPRSRSSIAPPVTRARAATWSDGRSTPTSARRCPRIASLPLPGDGRRGEGGPQERHRLHDEARVGAAHVPGLPDLPPGALAKATARRCAATLWQTGAFHASLGTAAVRLPRLSRGLQPAAGASTQSTLTYALASARPAATARQWMNHGSGHVAGKDCAACHAADAKTSGQRLEQVRSRSTPRSRSVTTCQECHGAHERRWLRGGYQEQSPAGLTNSTMPTTARDGLVDRHPGRDARLRSTTPTST